MTHKKQGSSGAGDAGDLGEPRDERANTVLGPMEREHRFANWYEEHGKYLGIGRASCHIIYAAAIAPFKDAKASGDDRRVARLQADLDFMESLRSRIFMLASVAEHCSVFAYCVRDVARRTGDYETALFDVLGRVMEATSAGKAPSVLGRNEKRGATPVTPIPVTAILNGEGRDLGEQETQ